MLFFVLNTLIPGLGLLLGRARRSGVACTAAALACLGTLLVTSLEGAHLAAAAAWAAYALLILVAACLWWRGEERTAPAATVQDLIARATRAYLRDEWGPALDAALRLVRLQPDDAGCWQLLAMIEAGRGQARAARLAQERSLQVRQQARDRAARAPSAWYVLPPAPPTPGSPEGNGLGASSPGMVRAARTTHTPSTT